MHISEDGIVLIFPLHNAIWFCHSSVASHCHLRLTFACFIPVLVSPFILEALNQKISHQYKICGPHKALVAKLLLMVGRWTPKSHWCPTLGQCHKFPCLHKYHIYLSLFGGVLCTSSCEVVGFDSGIYSIAFCETWGTKSSTFGRACGNILSLSITCD